MSRRLPAYALGRDPNLRVVACSYSATLALQFSRDVQLIMDEANSGRLFPESIIPGIATKQQRGGAPGGPLRASQALG